MIKGHTRYTHPQEFIDELLEQNEILRARLDGAIYANQMMNESLEEILEKLRKFKENDANHK